MHRLHGLDALRGVAALLVLWYHLHLSQHVGFYPFRGYLAVDFFFMLSGYVMARTYEGRMRGGLWFLRKRFWRLWPTVTVGSLIGVVAAIVAGAADAPGFLLAATLNLLLVPILWAGAAFPINTPIWSIFFELFANGARLLASQGADIVSRSHGLRFRLAHPRHSFAGARLQPRLKCERLHRRFPARDLLLFPGCDSVANMA